MKTVQQTVYEFNELDKDAQFEAIKNEIQFHIDTEDREDTIVIKQAKRMEQMKTPWFLAETLYHEHKQYFIDCILLNGDQFTKDGKIFVQK